MQLKEAELFGFGKFRERKISFAPGINVLYGENESGKSTLHAFLRAMLFGMEKKRGRVAAVDDYQRYEPWHAPAYYGGALRFEVAGRPFYLERNFYHREKRDFLRNEADGEELSVAYGDLAMLLGGIQKEAFGNTYAIPQTGAAAGKEQAAALAEYLSDAAESRGAGFRVTRAVRTLREKRKHLIAEQRQIQSEKEQQAAALDTELEVLMQDCERLREDIAAGKERSALKQADAKQTETLQREGRKRSSAGWLSVAAVLTLAVFLCLLAGQNMREFSAAWHAGALVFGAAVLLSVWMFIRERRMARMGCSAAKAAGDGAEADGESEDRLLCHLREMLDEKETRIYNITEERKTLAGKSEQERQLQRDIAAAELAEQELVRLAGEFCEETADVLNGEVSRYISAITEGRYDSVRVDENGVLWAVVDGKEVLPETLSRGTLEQFSLALRLAVGGMITGEEPLPILLDETFVWYDDRRLAQALRVLGGLDRQVLLFTCQRREAQMLSEMGIAYHKIEL